MPADPSVPEKEHFLGLLPDQLDARAQSLGLARFRAQQARDWIYGKLVNNFTEMTNLSAPDRALLAQRFDVTPSRVVSHQTSNDGTQKLLLGWDPSTSSGQADGSQAETVMIPDADRRTACVSSQVGCPVGCRFCASGVNGVRGNLTAGQIVEQIYRLNQILAPQDQHISNVVFMGMGEPLANYAAVLQAVRILHDPKCLNMSARRITISTVGVPPKIRQLADEELPINLALSLHAPTEALRRELIPWAEHFALDEILAACRYYFDRTGREITLEYILLAGVNDRPEHASRLAKLCKTMRANVNLIRYNEVAGMPYKRPAAHDVVTFQEILRHNGVNAHVRKSRGRDIDAACGQLRRKEQEKLVQLGG